MNSHFDYRLIPLLLSLLPLSHSLIFTLNTSLPIHTQSSEHPYICTTLDWWPINKCDSEDGQSNCAWIEASALTAPITEQRLQNALWALGDITLRIGGTLADTVTYDIKGDIEKRCPEFSPEPPQKSKLFTGGCLTASRWRDLQDFCSIDSGCEMIFDLNGMVGRVCENVEPGRAPCFYPEATCTSDWDSSNAETLIRFTAEAGYPISAYELGNELTCLSPTQYAQSIWELHDILQRVYSSVNQSTRVPDIVATDAVNGDTAFLQEFLPLVSDVLYAYSWHDYPLGPGVYCSGSDGKNNTSVDEIIMDPQGLDGFTSDAASISEVLLNGGGDVRAYMGETGGAYDSGCNGSTNAFMSGFWYLNSLGSFAVNGHDMFCRQTLTGGNYELVNKLTQIPNPDFYSALLFSRLMGRGVLAAKTSGVGHENVRIYAHCAKQPESGVAVLYLNFGNHPVSVEGVRVLGLDALYSGERLEYILTGVQSARSADPLHSDVVALNGNILRPQEPSGKMPPLLPRSNNADEPLILPAFSYGFVVYPNMPAEGCE
mmetsp:Transcript_5170/g.7916  ORF Transcript_5170/g.7916 Transcript_5170/m.7916 type:complete len:544 (+) Transcript_5170:27-1658(+)